MASLRELNDDILKIEQLAVEYWSRDGRATDDIVLEAKIHGAFNASRYFDANRICGCYSKEFWELDVLLADKVTGGAFETSAKTVDAHRISAVMEVAHRFRAHLRIVRRAQYWAK